MYEAYLLYAPCIYDKIGTDAEDEDAQEQEDRQTLLEQVEEQHYMIYDLECITRRPI